MERVGCVSAFLCSLQSVPVRGWVTGGHRQERLKFAGEGGTTLRADYRYSEAPVTKQHTEEQDVSRRGFYI
jgi:hypothetical protein